MKIRFDLLMCQISASHKLHTTKCSFHACQIHASTRTHTRTHTETARWWWLQRLRVNKKLFKLYSQINFFLQPRSKQKTRKPESYLFVSGQVEINSAKSAGKNANVDFIFWMGSYERSAIHVYMYINICIFDYINICIYIFIFT